MRLIKKEEKESTFYSKVQELAKGIEKYLPKVGSTRVYYDQSPSFDRFNRDSFQVEIQRTVEPKKIVFTVSDETHKNPDYDRGYNVYFTDMYGNVLKSFDFNFALPEYTANKVARYIQHEYKGESDMRLKKEVCKQEEAKQVKEGWVSDESHSLWYNLANTLAHDLNCDVWINDMGWMELSKDEEQLIQLYIKWHGGYGDIIVNKDAKEQIIGKCGTDRLPEASYIANRLVSMGLWEL